VNGRRRHFALARLLSSAVLSQAVLSAASLVVGLVLIRHSSDAQYGTYVMASSAVMLLVSMQNSYCYPALASRLSWFGARQRADLVGGMHRELRALLWRVLGAAGALTLILASLHVLDVSSAALVLVTLAGAYAAMKREYFRMVLFAYRRPDDVLRSDLLQAALVAGGAVVAVHSASPALMTLFLLALAALASALALAQALQRHEPWTQGANAPPVLRQIAPQALWSTTGAAIHWTFSQGYVYLVAATLDISAVAAIAATRLLLMPVNLLSTGVGSLMLPVASGWLHHLGARTVVRRMGLLALGMTGLTLTYCALLWPARDWLFDVVLRKHPPQRDILLLLWGALCLVMVVRDQFVHVLVAQARFRSTSALTLLSAACALGASHQAMLAWGAPGALMGLLVGELTSLCGVVVLALFSPPGSAAGAVATVAAEGAELAPVSPPPPPPPPPPQLQVGQIRLKPELHA
jgi:O-antigen/teichoic acid export membrane protein